MPNWRKPKIFSRSKKGNTPGQDTDGQQETKPKTSVTDALNAPAYESQKAGGLKVVNANIEGEEKLGIHGYDSEDIKKRKKGRVQKELTGYQYELNKADAGETGISAAEL